MTLRSLLAIAAVGACCAPAFARQAAPFPTATPIHAPANAPALPRSADAAVPAAAGLPFQPIDPTTTSLPPQVYVADKNAAAESDDRGLIHGPGLRRPNADDEPNVELLNAEATSMLFTLEKWRAANGTVALHPSGAGTQVVAQFRRLIAFGRYSLFLRSAGGEGARLVPLDGAGTANSFDAAQDGSANAVVTAPRPLASGAQILLVYHSDALDHGATPGVLGHDAHEQLIVRIP